MSDYICYFPLFTLFQYSAASLRGRGVMAGNYSTAHRSLASRIVQYSTVLSPQRQVALSLITRPSVIPAVPLARYSTPLRRTQRSLVTLSPPAFWPICPRQ